MNSFNLEQITRPAIIRMKPYSSARNDFKGAKTDMIFLDANENPFDTPVNRYPDPQQINLKQRIAKLRKCKPNQILLGNGSDEVLDLLVRAFCEPRTDNILILPPTYGMYEVVANTNDIEVKKVRLTTDFEPNTKAILQKSNELSKILFLCSPNNPSGNSFKETEVLKLLDNFKGLVVIDEAYIDFSGEDSFVKRLNEYPNLVVTQTLSKAFGMAGIRLGICYASEAIISVLNKIKPPYNINVLTQEHALNGLSNLKKYRYQTYAIIKERERLWAELNEISCIKKVYPSKANFFLVEVDDAEKRYKQLISMGIVVRNRSSQPLCKNCLRFTIGTTSENNKLIKSLKEI